MNFSTFVALELFGGIPCLLYYIYWGVIIPQRGVKKSEIKGVLQHIKIAYGLSGITTVYLLGLLLYFLYTQLASSFAKLFMQAAVIMMGVGAVFLVGNYYAFMKYEKERICG